jgi:succinate dehydrogenase / fumarate reductase, cytochrome b subunit
MHSDLLCVRWAVGNVTLVRGPSRTKAAQCCSFGRTNGFRVRIVHRCPLEVHDDERLREEQSMTMSSPTSTGTPAVEAPRTKPSRKTLYRGDPGMWSWVLQRISGATIFFFLFVHVLDTALVRVSPQAYNEVVATYKTPIVGLMEAGLVAAVLYHALNGIRVILIDSWSEGPRHQRLMLWIVGVVFVAVLAAALIVLGAHMAERFL